MPGRDQTVSEKHIVLICQLNWNGFVPGDIIEIDSFTTHEISGLRSYIIADTGNGEEGYLPLKCTYPCPPDLIHEENITEGSIIISRVNTLKGELKDVPTPELTAYSVEIPVYPGFKDQQLQVYLPEWTQEPKKIELINSVSGKHIVDEDAMNYISGRHVNMKLTDLRPGFYVLYIHYPYGWKHEIKLIKKYPEQMDTDFFPLERLDPIPPVELTDDFSNELKNTALKLNIEWGENFGKPLGPRILQIYPELKSEEIEALELLCNNAKYEFFGLYTKAINDKSISEMEVYHQIYDKYPWINKDNLSMLSSQGNYYAMRG